MAGYLSVGCHLGYSIVLRAQGRASSLELVRKVRERKEVVDTYKTGISK